MNGASAEYVTITEPSLDAPRLTTMLVQARAIEPHPQRIARASAATDRRGLDMRNLLVGSSVRFPGPLQHTAWPRSGEASGWTAERLGWPIIEVEEGSTLFDSVPPKSSRFAHRLATARKNI